MEEPSKPCPSSKVSSPNSLIGTEKCCQIPTKSINLKSTIFAPFFSANSTTCFGVICCSFRDLFLLQCIFSGFTSPDTYHFFYIGNKYFPITYTSGFGRFFYCLNNLRQN